MASIRNRRDDWGKVGSVASGNVKLSSTDWIDKLTLDDLPKPKPQNPLYKTSTSEYGKGSIDCTIHPSQDPDSKYFPKTNNFTKEFPVGTAERSGGLSTAGIQCVTHLYCLSALLVHAAAVYQNGTNHYQRLQFVVLFVHLRPPDQVTVQITCSAEPLISRHAILRARYPVMYFIARAILACSTTHATTFYKSNNMP